MSLTGVKDENSEKPSPSGKHSPVIDRPNMSMRRLVLVGKTGAGKSSSGNTILGRRGFRALKSGSSVTKVCRRETEEVDGREIMLVDTPGLFDTSLSETELKQEICKCIKMSAPGPHAIILVIQLGPFTKEECQAVEKIRALFGEESDKYIMILFTHGDDLTDTIEEYLSGADEKLQDLVHRCGERYHVFNNKTMEDRKQVLEFLEKVDSLVSANEHQHFTSELYRDVERRLRRREEELKRFYEQKLHEQQIQFQQERRKLQETIDALKESDQEKAKKISELQQLLTLNDRRLAEEKRFYENKIKGARLEAEETEISDDELKLISAQINLMIICNPTLPEHSPPIS